MPLLILAILVASGFVSGCVGSTATPEAVEKPANAPSEAEGPALGGSQLDPSRVCMRSACGTVSDLAGKPIAGAWLFVVRSDDVVEEKNTLDVSGGWLLHMRKENAGPRPWQLKFGAPGYEELAVDVPDPLPEDGFKFDAKLKKAP